MSLNHRNQVGAVAVVVLVALVEAGMGVGMGVEQQQESLEQVVQLPRNI